MRKASLRWHTIWCADIRPHRRALSGRTDLSRWRISALSSSRASVFMAWPSTAEQSLPARLAERVQRLPAARFGLGQDFLEGGIAAQRVEVRAAREGRGNEITLGNGATKRVEPSFVLAEVAEQPAHLEDGLRVVHDL